MNILYIGHEEYINGASKSLLSIIDYEIPNNNIFVLTSYGSGEFYDELKKRDVSIICLPFYRWVEAKDGNINWIKLKIKWVLKRQFVNYITAKKAAAICDSKHIDIIHTNTSVINIGMLISRRTKAKHVWHLREFGDLDFNMYPLISARKMWKQMNLYTDKFICISKAIYKHYKCLDSEKKILIYNGVENKINAITNKEHHSDIKFLIAGRISEAKGQKIVIEAAKKLLAIGIENFKIFFAGSGRMPDNYDKVIVGKYIEQLGYINDMNELRSGMDVELVCSRAEAFGRVTAEAMFAKMPVIGSRSGGTPELIIDGETGFLFAPGDSNELAEKMLYFIENPSMISIMGNKAFKYACDNFTMDRCVKEINMLYNRLVKD